MPCIVRHYRGLVCNMDSVHVNSHGNKRDVPRKILKNDSLLQTKTYRPGNKKERYPSMPMCSTQEEEPEFHTKNLLGLCDTYKKIGSMLLISKLTVLNDRTLYCVNNTTLEPCFLTHEERQCFEQQDCVFVLSVATYQKVAARKVETQLSAIPSLFCWTFFFFLISIQFTKNELDETVQLSTSFFFFFFKNFKF